MKNGCCSYMNKHTYAHINIQAKAQDYEPTSWLRVCLLQSLLRWRWSCSSRKSCTERRCASPARPVVNPLPQWCGFTMPIPSPRLLATASPPGCYVSPMWALRMMDCISVWLRMGWAARRPPLASSLYQRVSQIVALSSEDWFFHFTVFF